MMSIALFVFLVSLAKAQDLSTQKTYKQSTEVLNFTSICSITGHTVKGMTWSICREGTTKSIGCVTESGEKLKFGEYLKTAHAEYLCEDAGNSIVLRPVACILDGEKLKVNQARFFGKFYYRCSVRESGIGLDIVGCKDDRFDFAVGLKQTFRKGDFEFMCDTDGEKVFEVGTGCYVKEKGLIKIGGRYRIGGFYYQCSRKGQRGIRTEIVGCSDEKGTFVEMGDTFREGFVLYKCAEQGRGATHEPVGCALKSQTTGELVEYGFGDTWYEAYQEKIGYIMECTSDDDGIGPKIIRCVASGETDKVTVHVGCSMPLDDKIFICKAMPDGSVLAKLKTIPPGQTFQSMMIEYGVKQCQKQ